jgi:hypothetical protein
MVSGLINGMIPSQLVVVLNEKRHSFETGLQRMEPLAPLGLVGSLQNLAAITFMYL